MIRRQKNIRKGAPQALPGAMWHWRWVYGQDRSLLTFRSAQTWMCKVMQNLEPRKVTSRSDYRSACPFTEKILNAIYSYSYRQDSVVGKFILCYCAEARKSPTIGQLQEIRPFGAAIGDSLASIH
jgi:hypothetical protein